MSPTCGTCGSTFEVSAEKAARFPGWTPSQCPACYRAGRGGGATRRGGSGRSGSTRSRRSSLVEENLTTDEVLARYADGPQDGVFTDGSASPNPGPGGWGAVYVIDGEVVARDHGSAADTTNNRMELQAIAAGIDLVPAGTPATLYTDSKLAVQTLTQWAHGWARAGWTRKSGPIKNLDLVKPLFAVVTARPEISLQWIAAHAGNRWNEYADSLSTAYLRDEV
jgi:ribonuclease HI